MPNVVSSKCFDYRLEGIEVGRWERWEGGEIGRWERWGAGEVGKLER